MKPTDLDAFSLLSKPLQEAVRDFGFSSPTRAQEEAIPLIMSGENVLLISPTASGKTEASILPVLNALINERPGPGIKVLYITPLRALNRDLLDRLEWWCNRLGLRVGVRHGDTEVRERSSQARNPPDLLITTPETLQAMLTGKLMKRNLRALRCVIVDELHELAEDKRGSQLSLALERIRWLVGRDFQLIGLSATIGSPEIVGKFLVGVNRPVRVVKVPFERKVKLKVLYPTPTASDEELASKLYTRPEVAARLRIMRELISAHDSTLLFTNTRSIAEVLASRFRIWDGEFPISIHHGSLAKPSRISAERGLKEGELKGLVCTSSLELGIDVGRIDFVIQYMSPRQVTRLVQRVGRSGHRISRVAEGVIIAMDSDDALESLAIVRRAYEGELERASIPRKPLDVLAHQIVGLLINKGKWYVREILELFRNAYPYRDLTEEELVSVIDYMHSRYPRMAWYSPEDQVVMRPRRIEEIYEYYFERLSMIPDEKQYLVINEEDESPIGILDEAFVAEYGTPGTKFIVRGSPWKLMSIHGDRIYVKPVKDPSGAIPSWVGEEIPVPFEVAQEVGAIRRYVSEGLAAGRGEAELVGELADRYGAPRELMMKALSETLEQARKGLPIPSDKLVTVEGAGDLVIITCHFGSLVNRSLGRLLGHELSNRLGEAVGVQQDPYRIVVQFPGPSSAKEVIECLERLASSDIAAITRAAITRTGLFKRRLIHVARRFGAISKWADFTSVRLEKLARGLEGTAIFEEALKETLEKDLDVEGTMEVLRRIKDGEIEVIELRSDRDLSPLSRLGLERMSRKVDLIPPEKLTKVLVESTKGRILSESRTFACLSCGDYVKILKIEDLPDEMSCPLCGSKRIGMFEEPEDVVKRVLKRRGTPSLRESRLREFAEESAKLYEKYGKAAFLALSARRIDPKDAERILKREGKISDKLFKLIMEAEREALKKRFW
ncbi:MAG: DEAD/DEAH box helicase [Candidatus Bathyarchaeia archaeon]